MHSCRQYWQQETRLCHFHWHVSHVSIFKVDIGAGCGIPVVHKSSPCRNMSGMLQLKARPSLVSCALLGIMASENPEPKSTAACRMQALAEQHSQPFRNQGSMRGSFKGHRIAAHERHQYQGRQLLYPSDRCDATMVFPRDVRGCNILMRGRNCVPAHFFF